MTHICPSCKSDNIQAFPIAYENGTSHSSSASSAVGLGMSGGKLGIGVGSGTTHTTSMSLTAQKVAPPQKATLILYAMVAAPGLLGMLFLFGGIDTGSFGMGVFGFAAMAFGVYVIKQFQKKQAEYPLKYSQWQRSWLCHKCGGTFMLD